MAKSASIESLSNEILRDILDYIEADPEKLVTPDRRAYLSQESFKFPPLPSSATSTSHSRSDISNFRLVTIRFSDRGFDRLEYIASQKHLAKHVRKFAYMVPYFYVDGRDRIPEILSATGGALGPLDATSFARKAKEQYYIRSTERDLQVLLKAFAVFTGLQHVQILRLVDRDDSALLDFLRQHLEYSSFVDMKWSSACSHSIKTVAAAINLSGSPCSRFSSPMMSSQSVRYLIQEVDARSYTALASQITSLELHFDDPTDLDLRMHELSPSFKAFFGNAENLQAIHLGFPSHRPLSVPLDTVFHNVKWPKLVALGIQGWRLDQSEIISLARRHQDRLRGLRLRDILLKQGSHWKHVLAFLRNDMARLHWVSLRRIGYAKHFDQVWEFSGVEVPDDPPGGDSESDELSDAAPDDDDNDVAQSEANGQFDLRYNDDDDDDDDDDDTMDDADEYDDDDDDEQGPNAHEMEFPRLSPDRPDPGHWCTCGAQLSSATTTYGQGEQEEDIGDNGEFVDNAQRKMWEKWVVRRCPQHSKCPR